MYLAFFGLTEKPFSITPDPRYLYLGSRHADALAHLVYGINEAGGFIQLTGEVGTGKTTTIRSLLARAPKNAEIALILNPRLTPAEFLRSLCEELGIGATDGEDDNTKELVDLLNRHLLRAHARGRRVVLIVDEAQNLSPELLEQIRLLTNLETETQKLLQIILIGQPELRELLAREDLRQLAQRITGRYHLDPLNREDTAIYVRHRLRVAGATSDIFTHGALREVYRISSGIPRVINIVCDRALLGAYTQDQHQVTAALVRRAGGEVFGQARAPRWVPWALAGATAMLCVISGALLWRFAPTHLPWLAASRHAAAASTAAPKSAVSSVPPAVAVGSTPSPAPDSSAPATVSNATPPAPAAGTAPPASAGGATVVALAPWLASNHASSDTDSAFTTLLGLWNAHYAAGKTDGCSQATMQGLQCLEERGSLAQLRQLNRPAILMLNDDSGMSAQVVLRELRNDTALLQVGSTTATVNLAELTRYWFGDFVLLWHPPGSDVRRLSAGMHGTPVRQLREQLNRWHGQGAGSGSDQYDDALVKMVEEFQRANRLAVDGIAGIETQVALDSVLATPGSPVLQPPPQAAMRGG